jgi:hypothetical protein
MGPGLDKDLELLEMLESADFGTTQIGQYLEQLRTRFPGPVVADMFCLLQINLELAIRAKAMLMAREQGVEIAADAPLLAKLTERAYLERSIGKTGLIALRPLQRGDRDEWNRYLLERAGRARRT